MARAGMSAADSDDADFLEPLNTTDVLSGDHRDPHAADEVRFARPHQLRHAPRWEAW